MMDQVIFEISLFREPSDRDRSQACLIRLMWTLIDINCSWIENHPETPLLYKSGVKYHFDRNAPDPWQDIPSTIAKGWGDCEDLACWRIAELRHHGNTDARPLLRWRKEGGRYIYHALVRLPDGRTEDPSVALGMHGPYIGKPVYVNP